MIYKKLNEFEFIQAFESMGRGDQFSTRALTYLYDYLNEFDNYELDVIAICCEFVEYKGIAEYCEKCNVDPDFAGEELQANTLLVCFDDDCVLFANY